MTSPYLIGDLKRDEGLRLSAYPDPLSGGPPWTIGYGHTGPEVRPGLTWTELEADNALAADVGRVQRRLDFEAPWWRKLDDLRQDCLVEMGFNLGVGGLLKFTAFLALLEAGDFAAAADDLAATRWAGQVPQRAARLAMQIRTGAHA